MALQTANQTGGYGSLLAGVNAELTKNMRLGVNASTAIGQPNARNSTINVTLNWAL